jgi:hypothetical protein
MKRSLPFIFLFIFTLTLHGQKDTISLPGALAQKEFARETVNINVSIYPVPVKDNPQQLIKIFLENPKRGMYLVTIIFSDGLRVVKKIMVEPSE